LKEIFRLDFIISIVLVVTLYQS